VVVVALIDATTGRPYSHRAHIRRDIVMRAHWDHYKMTIVGASAEELQDLAFLTYAENVYRDTEQKEGI